MDLIDHVWNWADLKDEDDDENPKNKKKQTLFLFTCLICQIRWEKVD